jgi:hypothetical protein
MQELAPEREAIKSALADLNIDAWVFETDAGARPGTIRQTYLHELDGADLYIGLFWKGYGEYTIEEFENARAKGKDCLIYEKREAIEHARDPELQGFLERIGKVETGVTIRWFHRPEEVAAFIKQDVAAWQAEIVRRARSPQHAVPFQAPPRSDRYIDRLQLQARLKAALLPPDASERPRFTRAVLHGIGGIGKTSFAIALAHDPEMRRAYPHGVLWAALGQTPNLLQLQSAWGRALGDPQAGDLGYPDLVTGASQLRTFLRDRACLLVVDDAWQGAHVESAFLVGGPRSLLLVTTRQAEVAQTLDAATFELEGMAEAEALALFECWSGALAEVDRSTATGLARAVDYLPLALELIGAQIGRAGGWSEYRERWEAQRLAALKRGRRASGRYDNIYDSLELSVNALSEPDRAAYLQLAAFAPGAAFPASAAAALWQVSEFDASELLLDFADQALVSRREHRDKSWFGLHALLHDYAVAAGGRDGIAQAHRALIAGYRKRCPEGWALAADDGYLFDNLSYHFTAAGETAELYGLVGRAWMRAQFARSESHRPFAQDVAQALNAAGSERPLNWPMLVRCGHAIASLHAQAADMSVLLLETMARMGRTARALEAAALMPNPWRRSTAHRKMGEVLLESGARSQAAEVFRLALDAVERDPERARTFIAEELAAVAEGMHRCGHGEVAADLLRRADACLRSEPRLMNRSSAWEPLARARAAIEGEAAVLETVKEWLDEIEAASSDDAAYAAPNLARVLATLRRPAADHFDRLSRIALYLRRQGRGEWALAETVAALADCGALIQACDLLAKLSNASNRVPAATACARAAHQAGDIALTGRMVAALWDALERRAAEDRRFEMDVLSPARQLLLEVHGRSGLERLYRALAPIEDPVWRALALGQLSVGATGLGDTQLAAEHAREATRVLADALQRGTVHGEAIRRDAAISLAEAHQLDAAIAIVDGIADRSGRQEALCRLALKLLEQGDAARAEGFLDRALDEAAVLAAPEAGEVTAHTKLAEALLRVGAEGTARAILEAAEERATRIEYESARAGALVDLAAAWKALEHGPKARELLRSALDILERETYSWDEAYARRAFELAGTLYDDAELENTLRPLQDDWFRARSVLAGVVKGLIARGEIDRARSFFADIRRRQRDFVPWNESAKAESLAELVRLDDEKVLDWLQDGGGLEDPVLRAGMLGYGAAAWARLGRKDRAEGTLERALASAAEIGEAESRYKKLAEIARELAAAGSPALARCAAEKITESSPRDDALLGAALALVGAGLYVDAISTMSAAQDLSLRSATVADILEQLVDAGEYDKALACLRQQSLEGWLPYFAAKAARHLASAGRSEQARAMLQIAGEASAAADETDVRALSLACRAQALGLLGDKAEAAASATAALNLAWATRGAFVWAWCAEALARAGDRVRAAEAADRALQAVQDFDDGWSQAAQLDIAAGALAEAGVLDGERVLAPARAMANEYARADALARLYPHLYRIGAEAAQTLCTEIGGFKDAWAQADAIAALADRMAQRGDHAGMHRLLGVAQELDNKWAAAHALGRLASGLAVGGDPDDLSRALEHIVGYDLPRWRRAAALAMAARAFRRMGAHDRAADLAGEALNAALQEEDSGLLRRARYALQCATAALHLGDRAEAERQADIAHARAAQVRGGALIGRHELIDPLFDLVTELGAPERVGRVLELWRQGENRSVRVRALSEAGVRLARLGRCTEAVEHIRDTLADAAISDPEAAAVIHANAACVYDLCRDAERSSEHLASALKIAPTVSRARLAAVLETNAAFLASLDGGATLTRVFENLREVDSWWHV